MTSIKMCYSDNRVQIGHVVLATDFKSKTGAIDCPYCHEPMLTVVSGAFGRSVGDQDIFGGMAVELPDASTRCHLCMGCKEAFYTREEP